METFEHTVHRRGPGPGRRNKFLIFFPGVFLIVLGGLILLEEQLLRYLVAGFFILVGVFLLAAARQIQHGSLTSRLFGSMQERFRGPLDDSTPR
jgi:hypothetical protein